MIGLAKMIKAFVGKCPVGTWSCPVCGSVPVKSRIRKPLGPFVKDGPTVMEMSCPKCGHRWNVPLRVGP